MKPEICQGGKRVMALQHRYFRHIRLVISLAIAIVLFVSMLLTLAPHAKAEESGRFHIYAVGGRTQIGPGNTFFVSDNAEMTVDAFGVTWFGHRDIPTLRYGIAAASLNGSIYIMGGDLAPGVTNTVDVYDPRTDTWSKAANLTTPRAWAAAVNLGSYIYIVGGFDAMGNSLNTIEAFDPATSSWFTKTPMPTARGRLAAAVLGDKIYAIGGNSDALTSLETVERYDAISDKWETSVAPMLEVRNSLAVATLNGRMYVVGGHQNPGTYLNNVTAYDPTTNTWTRKSTMTIARSELGAVVAGNYLYAIGGQAGPTATTAEVERYDPSTDKWVQSTPMSTSRSGFGAALLTGQSSSVTIECSWTTKSPMPAGKSGINTAVVTLNGKVHILGGYNDTAGSNHQVYDPVNDTWSTLADVPRTGGFPTPFRGAIGVAVLNGKIYAIGGFNGLPIGDVDVYDPVIDTWDTETPTLISRVDATAVILNDKIFVIGGARGGKYTMEIFDPTNHTWTFGPNLIRPRGFPTAQVVGGKIYVMGGSDVDGTNQMWGSVEVYDPTTNAWTEKASMTIPRIAMPSVAIGTLIYVFGGGIESGVTNTVEVYDTVLDHWSMLSCPLDVPRYGIGTAVVDGRMFAFGGGIDQTPLAVTQEFNATLIASLMDNPPTVTITSPTSAPTWNTRQPAVILGGTVSDDFGVTLLTWRNEATSSSGTFAVSNGTWSIEVALAAGSNTVVIEATDTDGQTGSDLITIRYVDDPPTVDIISPTSEPSWTTTSADIILFGVAHDDDRVTFLTWVNSATRETGIVSPSGENWTIRLHLTTGSNTIVIVAYDTHSPNNQTGSATITVALSSSPLPLIASAGAAAIGGSIIGGLYGQQAFVTIAGLLYTMGARRRPEEEGDVRSMVRGYVRAHPGTYYSEIKRGLALPNGQLMHHLQKLEKVGVIYAKREGRFKRFFPSKQQGIVETPVLTAIQRTIVEMVAEIPGITQAEVAYNLEESKQTISHNVGELSDKGLLKIKFLGRSAHMYPADAFFGAMEPPAPEISSPESPLIEASMANQAAVQTRTTEGFEQGIRQRLNILSTLRSDGTISEEEYLRKRDQVLEQL